MWAAIVLASGLAAAVGYAAFDTASPSVLAFVLAFAGGALLTMLADSMMPEAFEHGGPLTGVVTTVGFGVAFFLQAIE
jgi:ZIP family zinc transporter